MSFQPPDRLSPVRRGVAFARGTRLQAQRELAALRAELTATRAELQHLRDCERRARHRAEHDGLTSLPNRESFRARLDALLAGPAPPALAVMFLDLDDFKAVNDAHGHAVGDALLCIVAQRLARGLRDSDMVCRLGGDEFACLLSGSMSPAPLAELACALYQRVAAPLSIGALRLRVHLSIGIARCPCDGDSSALLLDAADRAMYDAKRRRSGYAFFGEPGAGAAALRD